MSNWQTPITTWGQAGQTSPGVDDFNRMEGNIAILGKYDRAPGYGTATGTNTKTITLSPAPGSYYDGLCFAFKNITENTGAVTINVNELGAKAIKKPNGNDLVAGNLKAGSVYTVRYNGTNFILQGSDSSGSEQIKIKPNITILATGWVDDTATSGYWLYNIADTDITADTVVDVNIHLAYLEKAESIKSANLSSVGKVTLYADEKPVENIVADLKLIRQVSV